MDSYKYRKESKRRVIIVIAGIIVALAALGLVMHFIEKRGEVDTQFGDTGDWGNEDDYDQTELYLNDTDYISDDQISCYLLAGTDDEGKIKDIPEGYDGDPADFITLLLIDDTTEKFAFYTIDRNTMCDVPIKIENGFPKEFAFEQLCLAHVYGQNDDEYNESLVRAVTLLLGGLPIDGYYVLSMADIGAVNDAIGGVTVDIDTDMTKLDPAFTEGATVHLDGKQAEHYLRARMSVGGGTNKERMARQKQYMQKAYNMVIGQLRDNPDYVNDLYDQLTDKIQSDGAANRLSVIANKIMQYKNMGMLDFGGETKVGDTIGAGKEHEEFYLNENSVLANFRKVMDLREYTEEDEDEEDGEDE